jgi:hypothetical protein
LKKFVIICCFIALVFKLHAQKAELLSNKMQKTDFYYQGQNLDSLLIEVHQIYQQDTILPDDAAFFLGYALYKNEYWEKSKEALLRYVSLTKELGKYFDSTEYFVNIIDTKLNLYDTAYCDICVTLGPLPEKITCNLCLGEGSSLSTCTLCRGNGNEVCPRCLGVGFERHVDSFQNNYIPCMLCNQTGVITCRQCNGTKTEKTMCKTCGGLGQMPKPRICTHRDLPGAIITPQKKNKSTIYR